MILLSKKDAAAAAGDGGNVSSPNFDTIMCVLLSRFWKRSSLVDDAPTGESGGVIVVSTKTPRCFCPWCVASPDRSVSARTTNTQTDRKDDDRIIISLSRSAFDVRWGKMNGVPSCVPSLSLSFRHHNASVVQRKTRDARSTQSDKTTKVFLRRRPSRFVVFCLRPFPKRRRRRRRRTKKRASKSEDISLSFYVEIFNK